MGGNSSAKNAIYYSVGEIVPRVVGFLLLPLYTRYLSSADFGILSYTNTFNLFLYTIGTLSLNSYALRFYFLKGREEQKDMLGTVAISIGIVNLLILGLAYLILPGAIDYYEIQVPWKPFFQLALITNFMDSFCIVPFVIYRVKGAAKKYVSLGISKTLCMAAITIYMVCYLKGGLEAYYWSQIIVHIPFTIIYIIILSHHVNYRFRWPILKEGLNFSLPLIPASIGYILLNASDRIILERNVLMSELGVYNMAVTFSLALGVVVQGMSRAFEPELYGRYEKVDYQDFLRKIKSLYFTIVVIGGLAISIFSKEVFVLMTSEQFHRGYIYCPILVAMVCLQSMNNLYGMILSGDKRTKRQAVSTIVGGCVSVVLNILLIPKFGIMMAACTQLLCMFVMTFIKERSINKPRLTMGKELLVLVIMMTSSYLLYQILPSVNIISVFIKLMAWIVLTLLLMRAYGVSFYSIASMLGINIKIKNNE